MYMTGIVRRPKNEDCKPGDVYTDERCVRQYMRGHRNIKAPKRWLVT